MTFVFVVESSVDFAEKIFNHKGTKGNLTLSALSHSRGALPWEPDLNLARAENSFTGTPASFSRIPVNTIKPYAQAHQFDLSYWQAAGDLISLRTALRIAAAPAEWNRLFESIGSTPD